MHVKPLFRSWFVTPFNQIINPFPVIWIVYGMGAMTVFYLCMQVILGSGESGISQTRGHRLADVICDVTVMKSDVAINFSVDVVPTNVHPVAAWNIVHRRRKQG